MTKKIINVTAATMALTMMLSGCATSVVQERKDQAAAAAGTDSRTDPGTHQCLVFVVESPGFHARHAGQSRHYLAGRHSDGTEPSVL